jgi:hypothetical protein
MTAWHVYVNVQYCCRYARYSLTPTLTTLSCPRLRACTRQTASATISCLASGQQNMPCDRRQLAFVSGASIHRVRVTCVTVCDIVYVNVIKQYSATWSRANLLYHSVSLIRNCNFCVCLYYTLYTSQPIQFRPIDTASTSFRFVL